MKCLVENGSVTQWPLNETHVANRALTPEQARVITPSPKPAVDAVFQYVVERKPIMHNGEPLQVWEALDHPVATMRANLAPISPLQGILTLGETEWGKVLEYRETATWAEKIIIDSADDWVRTSQNIAFFGYLLGYTEEQMDTLFIGAAQVTA